MTQPRYKLWDKLKYEDDEDADFEAYLEIEEEERKKKSKTVYRKGGFKRT